MTDAERLLIERRRRGLAAWELAARASLCPTTYSKIENGHRPPTPDQKAAIARALGCEPEAIFQRVTV
jgi:transcriptional regulator with XRE-family HTH domain